ncbi:MAG: hypothetical protein A2Y78_12880 [Acidobacteria bacterium RBG_13_68_16]|nr:MAG: hypothetical protein A2Y78_12880 [Acidobacteria bacterium RBG_13_68_16]
MARRGEIRTPEQFDEMIERGVKGVQKIMLQAGRRIGTEVVEVARRSTRFADKTGKMRASIGLRKQVPAPGWMRRRSTPEYREWYRTTPASAIPKVAPSKVARIKRLKGGGWGVLIVVGPAVPYGWIVAAEHAVFDEARDAGEKRISPQVFASMAKDINAAFKRAEQGGQPPTLGPEDIA